MKLRQSSHTRPPTRLDHNKENIDYELQSQTKRSNATKKPSNTCKRNYDIQFPKNKIKKVPLFDQP